MTVDMTGQAAFDLLQLVDILNGHDYTDDEATERLIERLASIVSEDAGDDPDDEAEFVWMVERQLADMEAKVKLARKAAQTSLLRNVTAHGAIKLGDTAYRAAPNEGWELVDLDSLVDWIDRNAGLEALPEVFRLDATNLRITALKAVAGRAYGAGDDRHRKRFVNTIVDTFLSREPRGDGGLRLDAVYPGKAQWAQRLAHRDRDPNRKPKGA